MPKKVGVFMDYDNVFWTIIENYGKDPLMEVENETTKKKETLITKIINRFKDDYICCFNAYADFQSITQNIIGKDHLNKLQLERVNIKHVFSNLVKNENRKNASDIELSMDVIESIYQIPDIDTYVIISADGDMIPIINRLLYKNKEVILYYVKAACGKILLNYFNENNSTAIEDILGLTDLSEEITDEIIENNYKEQFLNKLIDLHLRNRGTTKYIGFTWFKEYMIKTQGLSGKIIVKILEYLEKNSFVSFEGDPKKIIVNEFNDFIKSKIMSQ